MEAGFIIIFFALLGASLGSFINVVASRTVSGRPWGWSERSSCETCGAVLEWRDLVPLFSWLMLRGRCRRCHAKIGIRCLAVEVLGAAAGGLLAWRWGISTALLFSMTAAFGLFLNALTDTEDGYVFDVFPLAMGVAGGLLRIGGGGGALLDGAAGAAAGLLVIGCIILLSRGGMGWGVATIVAGTGALLGWKMLLLTLYTGFMLGGGIIILLLAFGRVDRKDTVPLVPFLAAGGLITLLAGPDILLSFGISPGWPW